MFNSIFLKHVQEHLRGTLEDKPATDFHFFCIFYFRQQVLTIK